MHSHRLRLWLIVLLPALFPAWAVALTPDNIALIVNKNVPDGSKLADQYAAARNIPAGRIIVLDIPGGEEMEFDRYEHDVVPPVRQFLRDHHLETQVTCLVTFYGVPFRIRAKTDTDDEKKELADLEGQFTKTLNNIEPAVVDAETLAKSLDPAFKPAPKREDDELDELSRRADEALTAAGQSINGMKDLDGKKTATGQLITLLERLGGDGEILSRVGAAKLTDPNETPEERQRWVDLRDKISVAGAEARWLEERRYDADARAQLRTITAAKFGPINLARALKIQIDYLKPGVTNAALDSELSLLWSNYYLRSGPQLNRLNFKAGPSRLAPMVMVSRLDGPDEKTVENMISTSIEVERNGLKGCVALNSFGYPNHPTGGHNAYKDFDQKIRDLGRLVRDRTTLELHENYTRLFHNREIKGTACYCGWYSLRQYVQGMDFNPGAVGYHVASLEMVGLHDDREQGWVHGLLNDGVVATLGPVAEPYLFAFPPPQEFFPLLFTGKLTLAEVYWKTEPAASWMMCLVGDPLYTPYKVDPAIKVEDLSPELQYAVRGPARPATRPADSSTRPQ